MKKKSPIEEFIALSDAEKAAAVAQFDKEVSAETFKPLSPEQRKVWERAKQRRGRPKVGKGAERVSVTIERSLLKSADREAKRLGVSRAKLIALGLQEVMRKPRKRAA